MHLGDLGVRYVPNRPARPGARPAENDAGFGSEKATVTVIAGDQDLIMLMGVFSTRNCPPHHRPSAQAKPAEKAPWYVLDDVRRQMSMNNS